MRPLDDCDIALLAQFLYYRGGADVHERIRAELPAIATKLAGGQRLDDYDTALLARFVIHRLGILTLARLKTELPEVFNRLVGRIAVKSVNVCISCTQAPCMCPDSTHAEA